MMCIGEKENDDWESKKENVERIFPGTLHPLKKNNIKPPISSGVLNIEKIQEPI
jgi:hypothetical protein